MAGTLAKVALAAAAACGACALLLRAAGERWHGGLAGEASAK
jgi:hypothetical protein